MYILGVCDSQDSGAVLFNSSTDDISAVNEERITRVKLKGGFPELSINELIKLKKIDRDRIDLIAVASRMTPSFIFRLLPGFHSSLRKNSFQFSLSLFLYILYQSVAEKFIIPRAVETYLNRVILGRRFKRMGINAKIRLVDHHICHAYSAYTISGFNEALIFTIDGLGDGVSFSVNIGSSGKIRPVFRQSALNDITLYYSQLTEYLGFRPIQDEGKVMGLAACCESRSVIGQARKLLRVKNGRFKNKLSFFKNKKIFESMNAQSRETVASSFQRHAEDSVEQIIKYWVKKTGISKVALSGGFFANIKVNQRISQIKTVSELFISPHMGDGGLALGAALSVSGRPPFKIKNVFWGMSYDNGEIRKILDETGVAYEQIKDVSSRAAKLLSENKIVARFNGAMEFGPRALGNRSILAQAVDNTIIGILNDKLKRDNFIPFAPSMLEEYAADCCANIRKSAYSGNFMNITFKATDYLKKVAPAAVHRDGTTRPQFVSRANNPDLHNILYEYNSRTNIPVLLNTSFNMHDEPIVCTPLEAVNSFKKSGLDYLIIGNFLVKGQDDE